MRRLLQMPLHYQILLALLAGAAFGLAINPGEVTLPDEQIPFRLTLTQDPETAKWHVRARELPRPDHKPAQATPAGPSASIGREDFEIVLPTLGAVKERFPELAARHAASAKGPIEVETTLPVTARHVHLVEDDRQIAIQYSRNVSGRLIVTRIAVHDESELAERHPAWLGFYGEHGGGPTAWVTATARYTGDLFLRLLRMITVPLILTSLVTGVASLGDTRRFGAMFGKTLLYYVSTSLLAIMTGLAAVNIFHPGLGAELPGGSEAVLAVHDRSLLGILARLLNSMIPPNPVQALADAHFLSIITFSILLGIFIIYTGGRSGEFLRQLFQAGFDVMMNLTLFIIRLAPIGVFGFILYATASQGLSVFQSLGWYMVTVFAGLAFHAVVTLPLILWLVARRSPIEYLRAVSPALMTAFSTASSNGTLPLTLTCVEQRAGISNRISSFVLPLGATVNMDGTALYEAVAVLFIAQAYFGAVPLQSQILVAVTALLASIGAAGIPHAGLVMMAIVLQAVDLPLEAQGLIIAVDRVLDMCRTSVNVWSDTCGCAVLARFDRDGHSL
ncbi:MAG: dicarboxylate/amino acid:cation symporter [Planctomycetes bacterium]|nr:dicarboxylate/amino acid:cation symporter [Planctomycetota bacterium]